MPSRPFTFLSDAPDARDLASLTEAARRAEDLGVTAIVLPDHLVDILGPVPYLAMVAAVTDRLRVSAFVFNNDLRHPAVLAKDLASLDVLSGGRLDVAIGAGWNRPEYEAVGLRFDPVGVRVARLAESIAILKGCFADGPFSFSGEHYTITDYDAQPKPVQRPWPPLFVGGGGRRILTLAGREADIVGLAPRIKREERVDPTSLTLAATAEKIGWVREAAGDRFAELTFNVYPSGWPITITNEARAEARKVIDRLRARTGVELTADEVLESPHMYIGSVESLARKFGELRDRLGISSFHVGDLTALGPLVERLAGT